MKLFLVTALLLFSSQIQSAFAENSFCKTWAPNPKNQICSHWQGGACRQWANNPNRQVCTNWLNGACQQWAPNPNNKLCNHWTNGACQSWLPQEGSVCTSWSDGWQPWY